MENKEYENLLFEKILPRLFNDEDVITNIQKETFDYFIHHRLQRIIEEEPSIDVYIEPSTHIQVMFSQIYVDNPYIIDEKRQIKYITPNEARIRELTYSSSISVDVYVKEYLNNELTSEKILRKVNIARIPMMIGTSKCNLFKKTKKERILLGECKYDNGGYFIIKGKERVLITQERGNLNNIYIFQQKPNVKYRYIAEIRSSSEENGHSVLVQMRLYPINHRITLLVPFFSQEIPLSYVLLVFGYTSENIDSLLNKIFQDNDDYRVSLFLKNLKRELEMNGSSDRVIQEMGNILVHSMIKEHRSDYIIQILNMDMFPHIGMTSSCSDKALFLIYMLHKLLSTYIGKRSDDDRDHLNNKRFETAGYLLSELFRALYKRLVRTIEPQIQKKHDINTILNRTSMITQSIKTCFATGNWGIPKSNYIRCGVSQILSRLSFNATISHLRRVLIPIGKEGKNSKIRQIHSSQFGFICALECFDPNTSILLWNGTIKLAKNIIVGDVLIDENGKPTSVRKTVSGINKMYEIKPIKKNFMNHIVTSNHILTLKVRDYKSVKKSRNTFMAKWFDKKELRFRCREGFLSKNDAYEFMTNISDNNIIDITIDQYLPLSNFIKKHLVLFKCNGIQWEKQHVELDPYILGMWLGDGDSNGTGFTTEDSELLHYWERWAVENDSYITLHPLKKYEHYKYNYTYKSHQISDPDTYRPDIRYSVIGNLKKQLSKYNLIQNKHIPKEFLLNDRETRLRVLAGLIDTDGSVRANGHEIRIQQGPANTKIVKDALLLAQSLGFSCHLSNGISKWTDKKTKEKKQSTYTELTITGEFIYEIPTLLPRKKLNNHLQNEIARKRCSSFLQSLFTIEKKEISEFVGFQLNGNGRFLLSDCIVSHNTPEGASAGIVKNFTLFVKVSTRVESSHVQNILESHFNDLMDENAKTFLLLNGRIIGHITDCEQFIKRFRYARSQKLFSSYISIYYDISINSMYINSDDGRIVRPLWNIRDFNWDTICYHIKQRRWNWHKLVDHNMIIYVDSYEVDQSLVAMTPDDITPDHDFLEIHASFMFGICVHLIPYVDHIQAPRITYQASMSKQAIGIYASNNPIRCDTVVHCLQYPEKPIVQTHFSELLNYEKLASGNNLIVAVACYGGYNQEDSVIFNQSSIDRGLFRCFTYRTIMTEEKKRNNNSNEIIELPDISIRNSMFNYSKLNSRGIIYVGSYVGPNDVIIGKTVFTHKKGVTTKTDNSLIIRNGEEGYIDRIYESVTPDGYLMIKVKIRYQRIPEMGDKVASRSAQKGTIGICLRQEDMPFTPEGIVPDVIINPHCFLGNTLVCLTNGTAKRIDHIVNNQVKVRSYNDDNRNIVNSYSSKSTCYGIKPTIKLTFIDGREIICTPDHNIRVCDTNNNVIWKQAKDLEYTDRIIMGLVGTEDIIGDDEKNWELTMGTYTFHMIDDINREKSLAFARILGYLLTDGCISVVNRTNGNIEYISQLAMGSIIDCESILDDIELLTNKRPQYYDSYSIHTNSKTFNIRLSNTFTRQLILLENISIGRKTTQDTSYPTFLLTSPKSIVREFLAGLFGGDGWTTYYRCGLKKQFTKIQFSQSVCLENFPSLEQKFEMLIELMNIVGVNAKISRIKDCIPDCITYMESHRVSLELQVESNEQFRKYIGFRHCIQKMLRLEMACVYENYCNQIRNQHQMMIDRVRELKKIHKRGVQFLLETARTEIYQDMKPLNDYYSLLTKTIVHNKFRKDRSDIFQIFDYKYMMKASEFIEMCGCSTWFDKHTYIIDRNDNTIPNYYLTIMKKEDWLVEPVYCITVENFHNFFAYGTLVMNCIPSRMTINQLMECIACKSAVTEGKFVYSTPFSQYSHDIVETLTTNLHNSGFQKNGNEVMYNGLTGEMFKTMIFIGPTYYQRLKHLVASKIHARDHGSVQSLVRQPLEGRSKEGGLRFGEMERDATKKDTPISLRCGISIKIQDMYENGWKVLSWCKERQGIVSSIQTEFLDKGERDCFEITLEDGRKFYPSIRHPFLNNKNEWVLAKDILPNETILQIGLQYPVVDIYKEIIDCNNWSLYLGEQMILQTNNKNEILKTYAFMRILGLLITDGHITSRFNGGILFLGHLLDIESCLDDIELIYGMRLNYKVQKNIYEIHLPSSIMSSIITHIDGLTRGNKTTQHSILPQFILQQECPISIVREFLGGLFGGDGHTCILGMHRSKRDILTSISFSKSSRHNLLESLQKYIEDIKMLLNRCGINNITIQNAKETTNSKQKQNIQQDDRTYSIALHLDMNELIPFYEKIGFRHCVHKSVRLEAGVSYKRLRNCVIQQHNWLVQRVDELTQFSKIKKENPKKIVPTKKAIIQAVKELTLQEPLLHEYAIPSTHDITDHLVKGTTFGKFTSKSFPTAEQFIEKIGALDWFIKKKEDDPKCLDGITYGVKRGINSLPTMNLKVLSVKPIGLQPVYDIQVDKTESFLANGVVAHNCMISHGVSRFLNERLFDLSDRFQIMVCKICGCIPNSSKRCIHCDQEDSIYYINMPYACKLLFQELMAIGLKIHFRLKE